MAKILIVDDELPIREVLSATLKDDRHEVQTAQDGESGLKAMQSYSPEIVFLDIWMPGSLDGIEVLTKARGLFPQMEFVMISGHGTIETAVRATKLGAWDFIEKPLSMDKISIVISNILQYQAQKEEKTALLNKLRRSIALVGEAPKIIALKQMIARVAPTPSNLLLTGENGVGKELVAQNIHYLSPRASRSFVEMNVAFVPEDLVEMELFGIEKGALPGMDRTQKGKLEAANEGTLFVEDLARLSPLIQEKLAKTLIEKKFQRIGGKEGISIDVRFIGASESELEQLVQSGKFSGTLFRAISTQSFKVPSLREHAEDIPALINHFGDQAAKESGTYRKVFSDQAIQLMMNHTWPGNVRELRNFIERVYILTPSDFVDIHDLKFAGLSVNETTGNIEDLPTFREARARFEKEYLVKKIQENNGNISRTAEEIGLERSYLHRKIKSFGIEVQKGNEEI
ncbi:MAG: sigma-54 dependent transcriptional regulator [Proteobacteria bacterium]|jgi:two-component system nitrogen regulation response regulator NtrX|nr:sigma-54 dependent transcriptional regulator [Pseudomonadota bacterium]